MQYEVKGEPTPVVICRLSAGESMITEKGSMVWMSPNMEMQTSAGGIGKAFGRMFSGESMFQNVYTAKGGPGMIAFASSFPGAIRAVEITPNQPIVAQKSAFLAAEQGVELSVFFQKKLGAGFFGGEGFIMQKISGRGMAFLEIDGYGVEYDLRSGEQMVVDTGNLAVMDATCSIDIQSVKGMKNVLFGGEGLFNTVVTGPGRIILQTMPISTFAGAISAVLPSKS
ncbi:MAG: TIGR00266 family protein [Lawsonibacter sp.]